MGCCFLLPCWLSILNIGMCTCQLGGASGKEPTCQCRRHERRGFDSWVWKILWRKARQRTPRTSCLENPMDRGARKTTVHRVTQSRIQLKQLSMHAHRYMSIPNSQSGLRTILTKVPIPPCLQEVCSLLSDFLFPPL